jgi:hypothetical protein
MDPQLLALLSQLESILSQITSISGGAAVSDEVPASSDAIQSELNAQAANKMAPDGDENKIEKEVSGPTASDPAKERLEDTTTAANMENIEHVGKMLKDLLAFQKNNNAAPAQRQVIAQPPAEPSMVAVMTTAITKALSPIMQSVNTQGEALVNMMDALGVSEKVLSDVQAQTVQKSQTNNPPPVANLDSNIFMKQLAEAVVNVTKNNDSSNNDNGYYRKGMGGYNPGGYILPQAKEGETLNDVMPQLFRKNLSQRGGNL